MQNWHDKSSSDQEHAAYTVVQHRPIGRYLAIVATVVVFAAIVHAFAVGKIDWATVGTFLFDRDILFGIVNTLILTALAMLFGVLIGLITALMVLSTNGFVRGFAYGYIYIFRSIPMLLQLLLWYNLALIFPNIGVPGLLSYNTTDVMTPFVAAMLAFGIGQGAYTSEVIRSGLLSVGKGQVEAAMSIGMTAPQRFSRIVFPQAMRVIVPPLSNETIGMVKYTSLASIIQYKEIIYSSQAIYFTNGRVIELLLVCSVWYLVVVGILSIGQLYIERYYNRSSRPVGVSK